MDLQNSPSPTPPTQPTASQNKPAIDVEEPPQAPTPPEARAKRYARKLPGFVRKKPALLLRDEVQPTTAVSERQLSSCGATTTTEAGTIPSTTPADSPEDAPRIDRNHSQQPPSPLVMATGFPASVLTGLGGEFVNLYAPCLESPPEFLFAAWHTCFGIALSRYVRLDLAFDARPRAFTVLLGESAIPRKSTAVKVAVNFWERPGVKNPYFRVEYGIGSAEGFARVFNGWTQRQQPDTRPTLFVLDELQLLVEKAKQRGSIVLQMLATLFESETYDGTTVKRQVSLRNCHVGLLAASTIDTYARMWTPEFTAIGFPNRLFIVKGDAGKLVALPKAPSAAQLDSLRDRTYEQLDRIRQWSEQTGGRIGLTADAERRWAEYYPTIDRSVHAKRLDAYAFRWMMLLALSREEFEVGTQTVDQAIELMEYELRVRKLYDPIDADNNVARMEEKIRRILNSNPAQWYTWRYLQQHTHSNRVGNWCLTTALENLRQSGEIEIKRDGTRKAWKWVRTDEV